MEKCEKLLNHIEEGQEDKTSKIWLDIEAHAKTCPDCSVDINIFNKTKDVCSNLNEVDYPEDLHSSIMLGLEYGIENETSSTIDSWFDKVLEPLQLGFVTVSVFMIFFLFSLPSTPNTKHPAFHNNKIIALKSSNSTQSKKDVNSEQLDNVSASEVKEFLARLDQYKKLNPEIENKYHKPMYHPKIRLVNDWKN